MYYNYTPYTCSIHVYSTVRCRRFGRQASGPREASRVPALRATPLVSPRGDVRATGYAGETAPPGSNTNILTYYIRTESAPATAPPCRPLGAREAQANRRRLASTTGEWEAQANCQRLPGAREAQANRRRLASPSVWLPAAARLGRIALASPQTRRRQLLDL